MGAALGYLAHWSTRGRRVFASRSAIVAARYEVLVDEARAVEARELLGRRA